MMAWPECFCATHLPSASNCHDLLVEGEVKMRVVAAWGNGPSLHGRWESFLEIRRERELYGIHLLMDRIQA